MNNKDLLNAIGQADERYIVECAPDRPYRRARVLRVLLVAAIISILTAATALTVSAQIKTPDEITPTAPVTESETQTKETPTPVKPTETNIEPTPVEPTTDFTNTDQTFWSRIELFPPYDPIMQIPSCAIIKITDITDNRIVMNDESYKEISCEIVYTIGGRISNKTVLGGANDDFEYEDYDAVETMFGQVIYYLSLKGCFERGYRLFVSELHLAGIRAGDTVYCEINFMRSNNQEFILCVKKSDRCLTFTDGTIDVSTEYKMFDILYRYDRSIYYFRRLINSGYTFVHKELFDRLPNGFANGRAGIEDIIEVSEWYWELLRVLKITNKDELDTFGVRPIYDF